MTRLFSHFLLLFGCVMLPLVLGFYDSADSKVIELTEDNWGLLENSDHAWIVEFYAPWCGHCKEFAPQYEKAASKLEHLIKVAAVDADAHPELASQFGVKGFPTIKFFPGEATTNPYTHKVSKAAQDYTGPRTTKGLVDFALPKQPSYVQSLTSTTKIQNADSLPVMYLFTSKESTSPILKSLSTEFKGRLVVAEVRQSEKELCAKFEVTSFPSILVQKHQDQEVHRYSGDISFVAISEWILQFVPEKKPVKAAETQEPGLQEVVHLAEAELDSTLKANKDAWLVVFRSSDDSTVPGLGKLALALQGQAKVAIVRCEEDCSSLGITQLPSLRVYAYGRSDKSKPKTLPADEDGFKEAKKIIGDSLPTNNIVQLTEESADAVLSNAVKLKGKAAVLLFSDKPEPNGLFRALSLKYRGVLLFAFASHPSDALKSRFNVNSLPFILALFPDPSGKPKLTEDGREAVEFKGASVDPRKMKGLTFATLDGFLSQIAALHANSNTAETANDGNEQADDSQSGQKFRPAEQPTGPIPELTADSYDSLCGEAGGLCAIAVLDGSPKALEERQKQLDILKEVRKRKSPSPFHFSWLDGGCHIDFLMGLDIPATDMPTLVILSPKKNRLAKLVGKYDATSLSTFAGGVLNNRVLTTTISTVPKLESDCSKVYEVQEPEADQALEDDILAEILAEEKARKQALEEELKREAEAKRKAEEEEGKKKNKKNKKKKGKKQEL